jgi:hypothetical protein
MAAIGLAVTLTCFISSPVSADCQPVESVEAALQEAEVAFVGTAVASARGVGQVTFRVEEAWAGTLGASVEVFGLSREGPSEDDRFWELGRRYLVIPYVFEGRLVDHICSGTTLWSEELAALRPPTATPEELAPAPASPPWPALIAVAIAAVLVLMGWLAFQRTGATR